MVTRERAAPTGPVAHSASAVRNDSPFLRACWHPIARSHEVTATPAKLWLLGEPLVAYRVDGHPVVLIDRCPHRRAPLSAGTLRDGMLECAYHGWQFRPDGSCAAVPSLGGSSALPPRARAVAPAVRERHGLVFVALEPPLVDLPEVPELEDPTRVIVDLDTGTGPYAAALLIDNQLDIAHFSFLHRGTFGAADEPTTQPYEVYRDGFGFSLATTTAIAAANDPGVAAGIRPLRQHRAMSYRYRAPFHVELTLDYPVMGGSTAIAFFAQPETAHSARLFVTLGFCQEGGFADAELAARVEFERRILAEDLALQARFDRDDLPLDLPAECHVKADRASVEYRRILADLARTYAQRTPA
jgi:vanillate O-demethylase monooxygenase subunit